jgi:hypothetical protein
MHSNGDVGAQFLHSAFNVLSIPAKFLLCSLVRIGDKTLPIYFFSFSACARRVDEVSSSVLNFFLLLLPFLTRVIIYDSRHI